MTDTAPADDTGRIFRGSPWNEHPDRYGYVNRLTVDADGKVEWALGESDQGEVHVSRHDFAITSDGRIVVGGDYAGRLTRGRFEFNIPYQGPAIYEYRLDFEPKPKPFRSIGPFYGWRRGATPHTPRADVPARLEYCQGNSMFGGESIVWKDGQLVWLTFGHNGVGGQDTREIAVPPACAWDDFWRTLARIRVWEWRASYPTPSARSMPDGDVWRVVIAHAGRSIESRAYNARAPGADEFRDALARLVSAARRQGREWEPDALELWTPPSNGTQVFYSWQPTRVATSYTNREPRRADGSTATDPPHPTPQLVPGSLVIRSAVVSGGHASYREATVTPSRTAWQRFWRLLDEDTISYGPGAATVNVWDALAEPDPAPVASPSWSVTVRHADQQVRTHGTGSPPPALDIVRHAIEELVADSSPSE